MNDINIGFFDELLNRPTGESAIDKNHAFLIFSTVVSKKPENILEIGIGEGIATYALYGGIKYNGMGNLTCVDNWSDFDGQPPPHIDFFESQGINIIAPMEEKNFILNSPSNTYDFIVSDGDHMHSHEWIEDTLRIAKDNAVLFFHDTNSDGNNNVSFATKKILERIKDLKLPYYHFTESSRPDERCNRGLLMVFKK